ncbi:hypothetical protein NCS52_01213500 [Fusarium sp. LHS14.1]|nr:hypothetical protein NCS52_01213500 [Fusarium sp. LHS14.1]
MRVLSFALALFAADMVVEAGVCKPKGTTTSVLVSSTATVPTVTSGVSVTESLTSAIETVSSESSIETLTSSTTVEGTTSVELVSSGTTEEASTTTAKAASTTTTEEASTTTTEAASTTTTEEASTTTTEAASTTTTEASTTTTEEASTTTTEAASTTTTAGPSYTPGSIVGTGPVADLTLQGSNSARFVPLSFASSGSTLIFTLVNNQLSAGNGNYLCMTYKDIDVPGPLVLCPFDNFSNAPLTCTRSSSGTLACTAKNGSCTSSGTCRRPNNAVPFSQFYVDGSQNGYFAASGNQSPGYTPLDLILAA